MKSQLTYLQLHQIDKDISEVFQKHPGLEILLKSKIHFFYQVATPHLDRLRKAFNAILDRFVQKDKDGKHIKDPETNQWKLLPDPPDAEPGHILSLFNKECKTLFEKTISLPI